MAHWGLTAFNNKIFISSKHFVSLLGSLLRCGTTELNYSFLHRVLKYTCDFPSGDVFALCSAVLGSSGGCSSEFPPSAVVEEEGKRSKKRGVTFFRSNASKSLGLKPFFSDLRDTEKIGLLPIYSRGLDHL